MAKKYWIGGADAVAQVSSGSIDSVDGTPSNNDFTVTIGGVAVTVTGDTDVATTAAALVAALNASTHPYFANITWTNPSGGTITGTADTAGVPFEATLSETGAGTATLTDFSDDTASAGPSDWSTAENWSDGAVPGASDDVILANSADNIVYGLDQNAITLDSLTIQHTYTGYLGLPYNQFATSADGDTLASKPEYREHYLKIGATRVDIGEFLGVTGGSGSGRIKINNVKAGNSESVIHRSASTAAETGFPAIRLLAANAGADVFVREATGGVGLAVDEPDETATFGDISISADDANTKVLVGGGCTWSNFTQDGGTNVLNAAADVTQVEVNGGTLTTEGDYNIGTLELNGGTVNCNNIKTGGNAITTANINGGTLNGQTSGEARTWATVNPDGGTLEVDDDVVTITTLDTPAGRYELTVTT